MKKILIAVILSFFTIFFISVIIITVYLDHSKNSVSVINSKDIITKGLSFSPKTLDENGVADFVRKAKDCCSVVSWVGDIAELENNSGSDAAGSGAVFVPKTAHANNLTPITIFVIKDISSSEKLDNYKTLLNQFVVDNNIKYLGIGNEINKTFDSQELQTFSRWFNDVYDFIKITSPNTKIFTVFQYESFKGLNGGLFGGENNAENANWDALALFEKADFLGFTSYPGLIYDNPASIPQNYWSEISDHTSKKFALTETGWFKDQNIPLWESSENEQIQYIDRLAQLINPLTNEFVVWSFLYDLKTPIAPFTTMGLISQDQSTSAAFLAWKDIFKSE